MDKRFPANAIHFMKNCAGEKGWRYNLASRWREHRWCPCFRFLARHSLPRVTISSSLRDLYRVAWQSLLLR